MQLWIAIVNAVDLGRFEDDIGPDFTRAQRGGRVRRKIRVACACDEDDDAALLKVSDRTAADERLGDVLHFDRGLDPYRNAGLL